MVTLPGMPLNLCSIGNLTGIDPLPVPPPVASQLQDGIKLLDVVVAVPQYQVVDRILTEHLQQLADLRRPPVVSRFAIAVMKSLPT